MSEALDLEGLQYKHIRMIRLRNTPEEFICTIEDVEGDDTMVKVVNPMMPVNSGNNQIGLIPWNQFCPKREFVLRKADLLIPEGYEIFPGLAKGYLEQVSNIKIVSANAGGGNSNIVPLR